MKTFNNVKDKTLVRNILCKFSDQCVSLSSTISYLSEFISFLKKKMQFNEIVNSNNLIKLEDLEKWEKKQTELIIENRIKKVCISVNKKLKLKYNEKDKKNIEELIENVLKEKNYQVNNTTKTFLLTNYFVEVEKSFFIQKYEKIYRINNEQVYKKTINELYKTSSKYEKQLEKNNKICSNNLYGLCNKFKNKRIYCKMLMNKLSKQLKQNKNNSKKNKKISKLPLLLNKPPLLNNKNNNILSANNNDKLKTMLLKNNNGASVSNKKQRIPLVLDKKHKKIEKVNYLNNNF